MVELRTTTRDLYEAAEELEADAEDVEERIEALEQEASEEYPDGDVPADLEREYQQLKAQYRQIIGTVETYKHYAAIWTDEGADTCEFTLTELNGDEFAKVMDTVQAEAAKSGSVPDQLGKVESLRFALEDIPDGAEPNPGEWPAPIVGELYDALQSITSPPEVEAGNGETLAAAIGAEQAAPADGAAMFDGPTTSPPDAK